MKVIILISPSLFMGASEGPWGVMLNSQSISEQLFIVLSFLWSPSHCLKNVLSVSVCIQSSILTSGLFLCIFLFFFFLFGPLLSWYQHSCFCSLKPDEPKIDLNPCTCPLKTCSIPPVHKNPFLLRSPISTVVLNSGYMFGLTCLKFPCQHPMPNQLNQNFHGWDPDITQVIVMCNQVWGPQN